MIGTDVPPSGPLTADLVCWGCSQRIVPYPDAAAGVSPSFCFWPCEHPKQSHGLCRDCDREYRACNGAFTEWMLRRREHMARVPGILRELLAAARRSPREGDAA